MNEAQKRNERKHRINLEENAVDQLDSAFDYFSRKTKKTYGKERDAIFRNGVIVTWIRDSNKYFL